MFHLQSRFLSSYHIKSKYQYLNYQNKIIQKYGPLLDTEPSETIVEIVVDKDQIEITDNGIGMTLKELEIEGIVISQRMGKSTPYFLNKKHPVPFFETSAKTGVNVETAFEALVKMVVQESMDMSTT